MQLNIYMYTHICMHFYLLLDISKHIVLQKKTKEIHLGAFTYESYSVY